MKYLSLGLSLIIFCGFLAKAEAKYLKYPSSCEYFLSKKTSDISKKDLECYAKIMSANSNKLLPKMIDKNVKMIELVPKGKNLIFKLEIRGLKGINKSNMKKWKKLKSLITSKAIKSYCSSKSPYIFMIQNGLHVKIRYKSISSRDKIDIDIDKKVCQSL